MILTPKKTGVHALTSDTYTMMLNTKKVLMGFIVNIELIANFDGRQDNASFKWLSFAWLMLI